MSMFGGRADKGLFAVVTLPNGEQVMREIPRDASDEQIRGLFAADMAQRGINSQEQAVQRPGMFGNNEQYWLDALKGQGSISAPEPTLTGKMHDMIAALGGNTRESNRFAGKATRFLSDLTPVGDVVSADDARQAWNRGDYLAAAGNAGLAALGSLPALGDAGAATMKAIIAPLFHGSPHRFDRFSLDKVGTGEGAQSYGHGLYFAENKDVAMDYRRGLSGPDSYQPNVRSPAFDKVSEYLSDGKSLERAKMIARRDFEDDIKLAREFQEIQPGPGWEQLIANAERGLADLDAVGMDGFTRNEAGALYEVELDANPEDFIDWDAPLSQQPERVRDLLPSLISPDVARRRQQQIADGTLTGAGVYHAPLTLDQHSGLPASEAWRKAGVPGLRYFDQGSRGAGTGTRNYVTFDDSLVNILRKY